MLTRLPFRTKLQAVLLTNAAVAMLIMYTASHFNQAALQSGKEAQIKSAAESIIDKIDRNLFERYGDVQAFALSESARSQDPDRIRGFIDDMMAAYAPIYDAMIVTDATGKVIATNGVDKAGKPLKTASIVGKNYSKQAWFKASSKDQAKDRRTFVEDPYLDEDVARITGTDGYVMSFSAPILDKRSGKLLGVWSNRMSWSDVVEATVKQESEKLKNDRTREVASFILDASGTFLFHPLSAEHVLKSKKDGFDLSRLSSATDTWVKNTKSEIPTYKGETLEATTLSKGYASYPTRGWSAIIQIPASDAQGARNIWMLGIAFLVQIAGNLAGYLIFKGIAAQMSLAIARLEVESRLVKEASGAIAMSSTELAQATAQQASAIQETAASIEQTNAMIKKSSESASHARVAAGRSRELAASGKHSVSSMSQAIGEISESNTRIIDQINESNRELSEIVKMITEIGAKTKVINEIVFQTKLLSFNASVEAARAGEHGKGFSVVAEEVGNLAQMSGTASKEISEMLGTSIERVERIVSDSKSKVEKLISENQAKVEKGSTLSQECAHILEEVVKDVSEVSVMMNEIASASQEQTQGVNEITKAMNELDQVTHKNSSNSQQASSSAGKLGNQANELTKVVAQLQGVLSGRGTLEPTPTALTPVKVERKTEPSSPQVSQQGKSKVLAFQRKKKAGPIQIAQVKPSQLSRVENKETVASIPSENDPRFKDI